MDPDSSQDRDNPESFLMLKSERLGCLPFSCPSLLGKIQSEPTSHGCGITLSPMVNKMMLILGLPRNKPP